MPLWTLWHNKPKSTHTHIRLMLAQKLVHEHWCCTASAAINQNELHSVFPSLFHLHFRLFLSLSSSCSISHIRIRPAIESVNSNYFSYFNVNNNNISNYSGSGAGNSNGGNANNQWSVWQQFQWPYVQPEQNRWSKSCSVCVCVCVLYRCPCVFRAFVHRVRHYRCTRILLACVLFKFSYETVLYTSAF